MVCEFGGVLKPGFYAWRGGAAGWVPVLAPRVEFVPGGSLIRVLERLMFVDRRGRCRWVDMGFVCDGGSKPGFVWPIFGHPFGRYLLAYIFHDESYAELRRFELAGADARVVRRLRKAADVRFLEMQRFIRLHSGFGRVRRLLAAVGARMKYRAVRLFGGRIG